MPSSRLMYDFTSALICSALLGLIFHATGAVVHQYHGARDTARRTRLYPRTLAGEPIGARASGIVHAQLNPTSSTPNSPKSALTLSSAETGTGVRQVPVITTSPARNPSP